MPDDEENKNTENKVDEFLDKLKLKKNEKFSSITQTLWSDKWGLIAFILVVIGMLFSFAQVRYIDQLLIGVGAAIAFKDGLKQAAFNFKEFYAKQRFYRTATLGLLILFLLFMIPIFTIVGVITFGVTTLFSFKD